MTRGPHGHEKTGEEILRVRCYNCGNRVTFEKDKEQMKCPHCGTMIQRPKNK